MSYDPGIPSLHHRFRRRCQRRCRYPTSIEYMRMYSYVFDNPNWMMNISGLGALLQAHSRRRPTDRVRLPV